MTSISSINTNNFAYKTNNEAKPQEEKSFKEDLFAKRMDNLGLSKETTSEIWNKLNFIA